MKKVLLIIALHVIVLSLSAQNQETATTGGAANVSLSPGVTKSLTAPGVELFNNGPLVNSVGTGSGGADESVLQSNSLGMNTIGFGFQTIANNSVADDFTFTSTNDISQITVFAYQTGAPTTSTISAVYLRIYDGEPGAGGSVIWGDFTTNRLTSSIWSGIYRATETTSGATNRPIMECTCDVSTTLPAGTYWLEIQVDGSSSYSGPWCPPVTINGNTTTGNGIQNTGSWGNLIDSGTSTQQGVPFILTGSAAVPVHPAYIAGLFALLALVVIAKRRFF